MKNPFSSIKGTVNFGLALVLLMLTAFGMYSFSGSIKIQKHSLSMEKQIFPAVLNSQELTKSLQNLKASYLTVVKTMDEESLNDAKKIGENCQLLLDSMRSTQDVPILDTLATMLKEYRMAAESALKEVISGKSPELSMLAQTGMIIAKVEAFQNEQALNFKAHSQGIQLESTRFIRASVAFFSLLVIFLFAFFIVIKKIIQSIIKLSATTNAISQGGLNQSVTKDREDEIGELQSNFESMRVNLLDYVHNLDAKIEKGKADIANILNNLES